MKNILLLCFALCLLTLSTTLSFSDVAGEPDSTQVFAENGQNRTTYKDGAIVKALEIKGVFPEFRNALQGLESSQARDSSGAALLDPVGQTGSMAMWRKGPMPLFLFGLSLIGIAAFTRKAFVK